MAVATPLAPVAQEGKFLSFVLGHQEYGLEILKVQEINSMRGITCVPQTPDYVQGVINLRGRVVPVVSLRRKFGMPDVADTDKTCIVVVQMSGAASDLTMGVVVDEVSEVLNIKAAQIETAPSYGGGMEDTDFIAGLGKVDNKVVVLLDLEQLLDGDEISALAQVTNS